MTVVEIVDDLNRLHDLERGESDPARRRELAEIRNRLAHRDRGAKVSEAAQLLDVSPPTVRAWIEASVLDAIPGSSPVRIDTLSLAEVKRAVDLVRANLDDRQLLVHVMRLIRDRAALEGADQAIEDYQAGKTLPLADDLKAEIARLKRETGRRSKSR